MGKVNSIRVIASAMFLFSSATAIAGPPYNLTIPATGLKFRPRVAQPAGLQFNPRLARPAPKTKPVLSRPVRIIVPAFPYTAMTQSRARRQGVVSAGGARWNCTGNRCATNAAWKRPTVQACKALARSVGPIRSYGKRGADLNESDIRLCNAGIITARPGRKPGPVFNRGLAAGMPVFAPRLPGRPAGAASGRSRTPPAPTRPRVRGRFAPGLPTAFVNRGKTARDHPGIRSGGGFAPQATGRLVPGTPLPGRGGFAPSLRVPPATNNLHQLTRKRPVNRTGGGFAPRTGKGFVPEPGVRGGVRTVTSSQALEMTGKTTGAAGGGRTVTSPQALEMTGKTTGAAGGVRTVTSPQALEMTGKTAGAAGGVRRAHGDITAGAGNDRAVK